MRCDGSKLAERPCTVSAEWYVIVDGESAAYCRRHFRTRVSPELQEELQVIGCHSLVLSRCLA